MKKACPLPPGLAAWQEDGHMDRGVGPGVLVPWSLRRLHVLVVSFVGRGKLKGKAQVVHCVEGPG